MAIHLLVEPILVLVFLGLPQDGAKPEPRNRTEKPAKIAPGREPPKADPAAGETAAEALKAPPTPVLKTPQAEEKFKEGMQKFKAEDYPGAADFFNACLKDASTPADKKTIQGLIDDTKFGLEIQAARKMVEQKNERKAIAKVQTALKKNAGSSLAPLAQKFIRETEELIYCILEDFEPGESFAQELQSEPDQGGGPPRPPGMGGRRREGMRINSDPHFVRHGKGSMKWLVDGRGGGRDRPPPGPGGKDSPNSGAVFTTSEIKNIAKWRTLLFSVYLPDADDGALRVVLAPNASSGTNYSLYTQKLIDLRGKKGWLDVNLDLNRDFANTKNVNLSDVRFIRIEYPNSKVRTIYLDFVHLE